jgi:hypothetical protein
MDEVVTTTASNLEYLNYIAYYTVEKEIVEFKTK